jgi:GT2 family glycosyltransferase
VYGDGFVAVRPGEWWATRSPATLFVPAASAGVSVVQNAGNELTSDGWVRDRGAREPDGGRYDEPTDVWGWCGGAVLLRAEYLADVGWFDERLFLYWEDVDLSWRGAARGWRYRYVPTSVVRHRHGASLGDRSPRFEYLNLRNRLVVLARHAGRFAAATAWARHVAEIGWFAWRDVVVAVLRRERPDGRRAVVRARALAGALGLLARRPDAVARAGPPPGGPGR